MAEPTESLWQTVKGDFRGAAGLRILGVAALVAWLAFQWGFGNDALLPSIATSAFDSVDDDTTWPSGIAAVGAATLAGFAFWAATQALDAIITLAGLRLVPRHRLVDGAAVSSHGAGGTFCFGLPDTAQGGR